MSDYMSDYMIADSPRPAQLFLVKAGTPVGRCRSCPQPVYWITTKLGRPMPVDCAIPGGEPPSATKPGAGVSHFATCPNANAHRKPRQRRGDP